MTQHSPARIVSVFLIEEELGTDPPDNEDWPVFQGFLSDLESEAPDDCIVVYDTVGIKDGRLMDGTQIRHPGIQVMVRSKDGPDGWHKLNEIATAFKSVNRRSVAMPSDVDEYPLSVNYVIDNLSETAPPIPIGTEPGTKRRMKFVLNCGMTLREVS